MANVKISELPEVSTIATTDIIPVVSKGITSKIKFSNLPAKQVTENPNFTVKDLYPKVKLKHSTTATGGMLDYAGLCLEDVNGNILFKVKISKDGVELVNESGGTILQVADGILKTTNGMLSQQPEKLKLLSTVDQINAIASTGSYWVAENVVSILIGGNNVQYGEGVLNHYEYVPGGNMSLRKVLQTFTSYERDDKSGQRAKVLKRTQQGTLWTSWTELESTSAN